MVKKTLLLILLLLAFKAELHGQAAPETGKSRVISIERLNQLRVHNKRKNKPTAKKRDKIPAETLEQALAQQPGAVGLETALKLREQSDRIEPALEEFILRCYQESGQSAAAISQAKLLLQHNESQLAHRILFKYSYEKNLPAEAEFHLKRAELGKIQTLYFSTRLFSRKHQMPWWLFPFFAFISAAVAILLPLALYRALAKKSGTTEARAIPVDQEAIADQKVLTQGSQAKIPIEAGHKRIIIKHAWLTLKRPLEFAITPAFFEKMEPVLPEPQHSAGASGLTEKADFCGVNFSLPQRIYFERPDFVLALQIEESEEIAENNEISLTEDFQANAADLTGENSDPVIEKVEAEKIEKPEKKRPAKASGIDFFNGQTFRIPALDFDCKNLKPEFENSFAEFAEKLKNSMQESLTRVIGLTSSSEVSNRTTAAFLLGKYFASQGKPTLIIDADFEQPLLNLFTDVPCIYGLKDLLARHEPGTRFEIGSETKNLSFLPSGTPDEKARAKMNEDFWSLALNMYKIKYEVIILIMPTLKKLHLVPVNRQKILILTLLEQESESSIDEFFFARITLKNFNFSLFQPVCVEC